MQKNNTKDKTPLPLKVMAGLFPRLEKYAPWLAKWLFVHIFFTPAHYPYPEKEKYYLSIASKKTIRFKGRKVQVYKWGDGKPVLMVHGWMGRATQFRKFIKPFYDAGFSIVAFDAPAHGKSAGIKSHMMYFVQIIEILSKEFVFAGMIGHSLGGVAGLHAVHRKVSLPKLIMIGSPSIADKIIGEFLRRLNGSWTLGNHFKEYIQKTNGIPFEHYSASWVITKISDQSLLLVYDEDDIEVEIVHGEELHKLYPAAEFLLTKGLGHTRILKDDTVISKCLLFISG